MARATPEARAERRRLVAELYPEVSTPKLAARLGVSIPTIRADLIALGIPRERACPRPTYPPAEERPCEQCGKRFTPENNRPERKFCSTDCANLAKSERAGGGIMTLRERQERALILYPEGFSYEEVGERLGITAMTARRDVLGIGGVSRRAHRRRPLVKVMSPTGAVRWREPSRAVFRFVSNGDWARYRWDHRFEPEMNLEPLMRTGWPGRARQRNLGKLHANKPPAPGAPPRGRQRSELTPAQHEEALRLKEQGWGRRAIANRLQVSERAVRNALNAP